MFNDNNLGELQKQLCDLKIAERRIKQEISSFSKSELIDFDSMKKLNTNLQNLRKQIKSVEAKIIPNIIA